MSDTPPALRARALLKAGDPREAAAALDGVEGDREKAALALLRAGQNRAAMVILDALAKEIRMAAATPAPDRVITAPGMAPIRRSGSVALPLPASWTQEQVREFIAARHAGDIERCIQMLRNAGWKVEAVTHSDGIVDAPPSIPPGPEPHHGAWLALAPAPQPDPRDAEIARLREALRFYADRASYNAVGGYARPVDRDHGRRAREALGEGQ